MKCKDITKLAFGFLALAFTACETESGLLDESTAEDVLDTEETQEQTAGRAFEVVGINAGSYNLVSQSAKDLVKADNISMRAGGFLLPSSSMLPKVLFKAHGDAGVKARLTANAGFMLGKNASSDNITDNVQTWSIMSPGIGFAHCAKGTGAFTSKRYVPKRGASKVKSPEEAINLSLDQVAKSGLLKLHKDETIDIVGVTSTQNAGWYEQDGELLPVYFDMGLGNVPATEFTSDWTVSFGRRYKGVPIIGEALAVRLDPEGKIAAFIDPWRDIEGEADAPIEIFSSSEMEQKQKQDLPKELELKGTECGYFEAPGIAYSQAYAGVGCEYTYEDSTVADDDLAKFKTKRLSAAKDKNLKLEGENMKFDVPKRVPDKNAVDIPE